MTKGKVCLAYSGGLDTSCILVWLKEQVCLEPPIPVLSPAEDANPETHCRDTKSSVGLILPLTDSSQYKELILCRFHGRRRVGLLEA